MRWPVPLLDEETKTVIHLTATPLKLHLPKNIDRCVWENSASGKNLDEFMRGLHDTTNKLLGE